MVEKQTVIQFHVQLAGHVESVSALCGMGKAFHFTSVIFSPRHRTLVQSQENRQSPAEGLFTKSPTRPSKQEKSEKPSQPRVA